MRLFIIGFLFLGFTFVSTAQESKADLIIDLVKDVLSDDDKQVDQNMPIKTVNQLLSDKAIKKSTFNKENAAALLEEAKTFKAVFITVDGHTIVKITDLNDVRASGAWGISMPKGKGYIQKQGKLILKNDYINNIIGIPNSQKRNIYMFK